MSDSFKETKKEWERRKWERRQRKLAKIREKESHDRAIKEAEARRSVGLPYCGIPRA